MAWFLYASSCCMMRPHLNLSTLLTLSLLLYDTIHLNLSTLLTLSLSLGQPDYDHLEKEVERRKMSLQEAKLKAKGLNPDGTPALSNLGGFSPGSKPCEFTLPWLFI